MPRSAVLAGTPCYVLMEESHRIGPDVAPPISGSVCMTIYGFSDKAPYDEFCRNSPVALKPYPLVQGYLRSQLENVGDVLQLVAIDAAGFAAPLLYAATMKAVLQAQADRATHVAVTHHLTFAADANVYRIEDAT